MPDKSCGGKSEVQSTTTPSTIWWSTPQEIAAQHLTKLTGDCWVYNQSPTLARNGEDHGYIRMDKYLHWYEAFWGIAQEQIHEGLGPKWTIS